jgi:DNA-binding CsgD family transcriptional regulator
MILLDRVNVQADGCKALGPRDSKDVTERQVEILCLLAIGLTSQAVAEHLVISEHTVVRHISNMMSCFGAQNRLELLALAVACGVVDCDHWPPRPTGALSLRVLGDLKTSSDPPASVEQR